MTPLPPGRITLRDARRGTTRDVKLKPFEIAIHPLHDPDTGLPVAPLTWFDAAALCNALSATEGLQPAYAHAADRRSITWDPAADGYRVPTEAEWEYACRAGTTAPTYGALEDVAWTSLDDLQGPQPVGQKKANPWGLHDMLGNVWEWCWDYADPARYGDYRTLRGGGWADEPWSVRASVRRGSAPDAMYRELKRVRRTVSDLHERLFYRPLLGAVAKIPGEEARLSPDAGRPHTLLHLRRRRRLCRTGTWTL